SIKLIWQYTASSCGVTACGISDTAPTVPCKVSRTVSPVNTLSVASCSSAVMLRQEVTSFDTGIFSGSQKLVVRRSQMSESVGSGCVFQLMPSNGSRLRNALTGVLIIRSFFLRGWSDSRNLLRLATVVLVPGGAADMRGHVHKRDTRASRVLIDLGGCFRRTVHDPVGSASWLCSGWCRVLHCPTRCR